MREKKYPWIGIWGSVDSPFGYLKVLFIKKNTGYTLEAKGTHTYRLGTWNTVGLLS